uniref:Saposin B-type domain-containing protein n=1 Tax=Caenorhabditis tropicalis TaxID=1561998 RepID=A0A1I7TT28_9PELO
MTSRREKGISSTSSDHSVRFTSSEMVCPSRQVFSLLFTILFASSSLHHCEATSVVTCMLCTVLSEPLGKELSPTSTVNAMFKKCDKMGLMEPVCAQFVSENVKDMFMHVRQGVAPNSICETMNFCDLQ